MDKFEEQPKEVDTSNNKGNKLSTEIVGRVLQKLSVGDRLKSERVSPLWKQALSNLGWIEQEKMDSDIVFEGTNAEQIDRFWENLDDGSCQLASLLHRCAPWLRELDLNSFGVGNILASLSQITESFHSLKKLEKLNLQGFTFWLNDFVNHLPNTLRELKTFGTLFSGFGTLEALSQRCPNLEEVPFEDFYEHNRLETEAVVKLIEKFPRQKKLNLFYYTLRSEQNGFLAPLGQLKELEQVDLWSCDSLDGDSFEAIVSGCPRLRSFSFNARRLSEGALSQLAKLQKLTVLQVFDQSGVFSDAVLKEIAARGQLKKLLVNGWNSIPDWTESSTSDVLFSDNSICYLIERCKSLVSLGLYYCPQITERSLEAVVAELQRRHRTPSETPPTDDPRIFYFSTDNETGIDWERAEELFAGNPWLRFSGDSDPDPREII